MNEENSLVYFLASETPCMHTWKTFVNALNIKTIIDYLAMWSLQYDYCRRDQNLFRGSGQIFQTEEIQNQHFVVVHFVVGRGGVKLF